MIKSLFVLPLLVGGIGFASNIVSPNIDGLILTANERGNYTLTGIEDSLINANEIRVYYNKDKVIDEIDDDAFDACNNLSSLMFS